MRTNQKEREAFLLRMQAEGVPSEVARKVLRHAATVQRLAVLACSSEAADRDRVRCPAMRTITAAGKQIPCLCKDQGAYDDERQEHGRIPRYMVQDFQASANIDRLLAPFAVVADFQGDSRGACVKLKVPSGRTDDWGQVGLCVPTPRY